MKSESDLAARIGQSINELDIDFSRFTVVGWIVGTTSLALGGGVAYMISSVLVRRNGLDLAAGMVFFLIVVAVTTGLYISLRRLSNLAGLPLTKPEFDTPQSERATRDAIDRMMGSGMDMAVEHAFEFWHVFPSVRRADAMRRQAERLGYSVGTPEIAEPGGVYHLLVTVSVLPTFHDIRREERTLGKLAIRSGGRPSGWGILQRP